MTNTTDVPQVQRRRVVVTGMGSITPLGNTLADYWNGLLAGKSGIGEITLFDASQHACRIAGEVKGFDTVSECELVGDQRTDVDGAAR